MNVEVFVLATASALRPSTSTAAVYALLASERPRPVLARLHDRRPAVQLRDRRGRRLGPARHTAAGRRV